MSDSVSVSKKNGVLKEIFEKNHKVIINYKLTEDFIINAIDYLSNLIDNKKNPRFTWIVFTKCSMSIRDLIVDTRFINMIYEKDPSIITSRPIMYYYKNINYKVLFTVFDHLLELGADINMIDDKKRSETILEYYCKFDNKDDIIKYLVEHGANVSFRKNSSIYYYCSYGNNLEILKLLIENTNINVDYSKCLAKIIFKEECDDDDTIYDNEDQKNNIIKNNISIINFLLENGAEISNKTYYNNIYFNHQIYQEFLIENKLLDPYVILINFWKRIIDEDIKYNKTIKENYEKFVEKYEFTKDIVDKVIINIVRTKYMAFMSDRDDKDKYTRIDYKVDSVHDVPDVPDVPHISDIPEMYIPELYSEGENDKFVDLKNINVCDSCSDGCSDYESESE